LLYCYICLQDSLAASFKASSASEVTDITNQLLAKLGDPYTRLLQGDDATALEAQEEGKVGGLGWFGVALWGGEGRFMVVQGSTGQCWVMLGTAYSIPSSQQGDDAAALEGQEEAWWVVAVHFPVLGHAGHCLQHVIKPAGR
jgi:hypothetical protein